MLVEVTLSEPVASVELVEIALEIALEVRLVREFGRRGTIPGLSPVRRPTLVEVALSASASRSPASSWSRSCSRWP